MIRAAAASLALLALAAPAAANDTVAELRPGGLVFVTSEQVSMEEEELYLSPEEVRVDYVFANAGTSPVHVTVAFPMPPLDGSPWEVPSIPDGDTANFLGFEAFVDGKPVEVKLQQRAEIAGLDVTDVLKTAGLPLEPFAKATVEAVAGLSEEARRDLLRRGLIVVDTYDTDGTGMKDHFMPYWTLRSTYHWEMSFRAGGETRVSHRYRPSVGMTAGLAFREAGAFAGPAFEDYRRRYCMDDNFLGAVRRKLEAEGEGTLMEQRLAYVLTTGRNWLGPIRRFRLVVDKGSPDALVSFCADGVEKIGPTTFEVRATDLVPERDLDILIVGSPR